MKSVIKMFLALTIFGLLTIDSSADAYWRRGWRGGYGWGRGGYGWGVGLGLGVGYPYYGGYYGRPYARPYAPYPYYRGAFIP
jgi:hypothetical protein